MATNGFEFPFLFYDDSSPFCIVTKSFALASLLLLLFWASRVSPSVLPLGWVFSRLFNTGGGL